MANNAASIEKADGRKPANGMLGPVIAATFSRLILNTARRFPYPFAPVLSRGMNVPLTAVTGLIAVNQVTGFLGIFFGPLADRFGYRLMMLGAVAMLVVGMFAAGFFPMYGVVLAALFLAGLGKTIFDPALQAYIGERVPYRRRGRIIGVLEVCWAGSTLVGIPLVAVLIDRMGWRSPFFMLGGLGLIGWLALRHLLTERKSRRHGQIQHQPGLFNAWKEIFAAWRQLLRERSALGALGFAFFVSISNDNIFVVYGAWLEQSFGLSVIALGVGTSVIGAAELSGEVLTATLADRLGLPQAVALGLALNVVCCALLPAVGQTIFWALTGLFLVFLTFEFTIVSSLSLCTELVPGARATMMSAFFAAAGLGRVVGALAGARAWLAGGITATAMVSAAAGVLGLTVLLWGLRGWERK